MRTTFDSAERDPQPVEARDAVELVRIFSENGAVHVRGAVEPAAVARVRAAAESVYAERERMASEPRLPADSIHRLRRFVSLDDLRLGVPVLDLLGDCFVRVGRHYLGREPALGPHNHVRWISPDRPDLLLPFHQDETIEGHKLLNVWIPLTPCGVDAPGLQVVRGSWRELLAIDPREDAQFAADKARIDGALLAREFRADAFWAPEFVPGDAMIFAGATAHRTHARPGMDRGRLSLELRLV